MNCVKVLQKNYSRSINLLLKAKYSRKSAKYVNSINLINSDINNEVDGNEFETINPNWELFGDRGFRFYLPGSVGPAWHDLSKTSITPATSGHAGSAILNSNDNDAAAAADDINFDGHQRQVVENAPPLEFFIQKCPILLRKSIHELFPGCSEVSSPQLTIITITQKVNPKSYRRSNENETEKLAKFFVIGAYDLCVKLRNFGYWADFINPFSGMPNSHPQKNTTLYKTDERYRCLGFKVAKHSSCRVITYDNKASEFVGSLYTTAPSHSDFIKNLIDELSLGIYN